MAKVIKEYAVTVGRTTIYNVNPEEQDDFFFIVDNENEHIVASVYVKPQTSDNETFAYQTVAITSPFGMEFVSPGILLDTALAAIKAGKGAHYGVQLVESVPGTLELDLLARQSDMRSVAAEDKSPERLLLILRENKEDPYLMNIINASRLLWAHGHGADCNYMCQYSSGTTLWLRHYKGINGGIILVKTDGTFEIDTAP